MGDRCGPGRGGFRIRVWSPSRRRPRSAVRRTGPQGPRCRLGVAVGQVAGKAGDGPDRSAETDRPMRFKGRVVGRFSAVTAH